MSEEEKHELSEMVKQEIELFKQPIDFDQLVKDGHLKIVDGNYICQSIKALPLHVQKQIKTTIKTSTGALLTFYKHKNVKL